MDSLNKTIDKKAIENKKVTKAKRNNFLLSTSLSFQQRK